MKSRNIYILTIVFCVVVAATVGVSFLLVDGAKGGLFYFNLIYAVFLELIMFVYGLSIVRKMVSVFTASLGYVVYKYVVLSATLLVISIFTVPNIVPLVWYIALAILMAVVSVVIVGVMSIGTNNQNTMLHNVEDRVSKLDQFKKQFNTLRSEDSHVNMELDKLRMKIDSLFPNTFNVDEYDKLIAEKEQLECTISELTESNKELVLNKVKHQVDKIINHLK